MPIDTEGVNVKKYIRITAILLVLVIALSGCAGKEEKPENQPAQNQQESNEPQGTEDTDPGYEPSPSHSGQSYQDKLMDRIPFDVDMGAGWEYRDLDVNGVFRRISVTFEMQSYMIEKDPCYTYYYVDIHGDDLWAEVVATGRAYLDDWTLEYVREYEANGKRDEIFFTLFDNDFKASTFKGKDGKDYIVFSIPANWEPSTSTLVIATDQGKLLADNVIDKSYQVMLEGDDAGKYMDTQGNANFFSFGEDHITYLKVVQRVDGITTLREYALEIENDKITTVETGKTYTTKDTVPDITDISTY